MIGAYSKPSSALIRLNLDERLACSGEHAEEPIKPAGIALSGTDGLANRCRLNELLAVGDVRLEPGEYPVAPGVIVDGHTLDLGGARLICTEAAYGGALIVMCGEKPAVINGRLSGRYTAAKGEPGYLHVEYPDASGKPIPIDSTIRFPVGGFTGALIDTVEIDHCCGYAVCPGGEDQLGRTFSVRHFSPKELPAEGFCRFELESDCPYITARHGINYGYIISDAEVVYEFRGADLAYISTARGVPGEAMAKPAGAKYVDVYTSKDPFVQYALFEYAHDNSLMIRNCAFWCNQRLGIVNLPGRSVVRDCRSWSNGYPREEHSGLSWDNDTSGFMDVEDVQTPYLTVINCSSADENLGIASRAYRLRTEGCHAPVCVYGGWRAEVYDHVGRVCHARDDCPTGIYVEHSVIKDMWAAHIGPDYVLKDCSVELCSALNRIGNFNCVIGDDYVRRVCVYLNGVVRGTILGKDGWFELGPQQGSSLRIRLEEDQDLWIRAAVSDSWGLDSNILVLPAGHTVHDSTFVLGAPMMYALSGAAAARAAFGGTYEGCRFVVDTDEPFAARALWFDAPVEMRFVRCDFSIADGLALIKGGRSKGLVEGSVIRFEGCTIGGKPLTQADAERIAVHDPGGIEVTTV